jgi:hypothetical protein
MQFKHAPTAVSAAFDDPNLVSVAGLVPMLRLAQRAGLAELAHDPASPGAGNGKRMRQVTKGPISAGRQWEELSGSFRGQPGRGAGRVNLL